MEHLGSGYMGLKQAHQRTDHKAKGEKSIALPHQIV